MNKMSSNSLSSSANSPTICISPTKTSNNENIDKKRKAKVQDGETALAKRTSNYKGVTKHKLTGRFEAHLWDKDTWNSKHTKKGRQVYLGAYDNEKSAAHTYDLAAFKYWGLAATLNFPMGLYEKEIEEMQNSTKEEYVATLRRKSSGFSRGVSKYRGVSKHHSERRWEARIGRTDGKKYTYLGTYGSQEEAAIAYDKAAIQQRGASAVTNFDINTYLHLFEQDHPHENEFPPQTNDDEQKDEQHNHNLAKWGKQDEEMNVFPPTLGCVNDVDLHKDEMMDSENVHVYEVEQHGSSCLNIDEIFKLNVYDDGLHEKLGESVAFFNNGPHGKPGESVPLFNEIYNGFENYIDQYDDLWPTDNNNNYINMFPSEPLHENYEFNQFGTANNDLIQSEAMNQHCNVYQDIPLDKEYRTGNEASDLVKEDAKEKNTSFSMLDDKGCGNDEAGYLVKEKRN